MCLSSARADWLELVVAVKVRSSKLGDDH